MCSQSYCTNDTIRNQPFSLTDLSKPPKLKLIHYIYTWVPEPFWFLVPNRFGFWYQNGSGSWYQEPFWFLVPNRFGFWYHTCSGSWYQTVLLAGTKPFPFLVPRTVLVPLTPVGPTSPLCTDLPYLLNIKAHYIITCGAVPIL